MITRRLSVGALLLLAAALTPAAAQTLHLTQDVPTDPATGVDQLPWEAWSYDGLGYNLDFGLPGDPAVDALHRMDRPGDWLFSVESPTDLAGLAPSTVLPFDVMRLDGGGGVAFFFCGGAVPDPLPLGSNVDAVFLEAASGGDFGDLILSIDVPAVVAGVPVEPGDLLRYQPLGNACSQWSFAGLFFDASASGAGIAPYANLIGADEVGATTLLSFDVPTDLAPSLGPVTYLPGRIASWDGASFDLFTGLGGWPISSEVDGLSCHGNPGDVVSMHVDKSLITPGDLTVTWMPSCSQGAEDYGIYEGQIGTYYSHARIDCSDGAPALTEEVTPDPASSYYLVVPHNYKEEGAYGNAFDAPTTSFISRPQTPVPADRCLIAQTLTPCP